MIDPPNPTDGEDLVSAQADPEDQTICEDLRPGDTYFEGPYLVFTAAYHLRRGFCCNSDCRHCPYK